MSMVDSAQPRVSSLVSLHLGPSCSLDHNPWHQSFHLIANKGDTGEIYANLELKSQRAC